jgi:hypothetical protein
VRALEGLFPLDIYYISGQGVWFNSIMTRRNNFAMVLAHRPLFRQRMSKVHYLGVGRGFGREELVRDKALPLFEVDPIGDRDGMEQAELEPTGEPAPLADLCEPATTVREGEICLVCMAGFEIERKDAVVAGCVHFFHQSCRNKWVNESGMDGLNACHTCHVEMYRELERRLADNAGLEGPEEKEEEKMDFEMRQRDW